MDEVENPVDTKPSNESQSTNDIAENNESTLVDDKSKDKDYEQADEVDDETTMEEEEALPELEDPLREIRFLEEESNMPIHELMIMYGYSNNTPPESSIKKKKKNKKKNLKKKKKDKKRKKSHSIESDGISGKKSKSADEQILVNQFTEENATMDDVPSNNVSEEIPKKNEETGSVKDARDCNQETASKLLDLYMAELDQVQSEDEDEDYRPHWELHWKSVNVGVNFQAVVTDGLSAYGDVLPYENNDELLWDPNVLGEDLIEDYLVKIQQITKAVKPKSKNSGVRDNEKALYLLVQCGHDVAEAIRRMSLNVIPLEKSLSVWSEEETLKFEMGLLINGKNFHAIQKEVKTRSVAELVHFYYFWKKSERYDQFERRQVAMRPELKQWQHWDSEEDQDSDFDNIFQENSQADSDESVNADENKAQMKCLIYADRKRQVRKKTTNGVCSNTITNTNINTQCTPSGTLNK